MTASPSEATILSLDEYAGQVAEVTGGEALVTFGTIKIAVPANGWTEAIRKARDELGLVFFSWLSAIDWSNEVKVGDPLSEPVTERFEVLAAVADLSEGRIVIFSTSLDKGDARLPTLTGVYAGADWHERECHEMFGIVFDGHPNLKNLYLPDGFIGHPLRKSFPLLSREVKPWPGKVDVEGMPGVADEPSEENPEA